MNGIMNEIKMVRLMLRDMDNKSGAIKRHLLSFSDHYMGVYLIERIEDRISDLFEFCRQREERLRNKKE